MSDEKIFINTLPQQSFYSIITTAKGVTMRKSIEIIGWVLLMTVFFAAHLMVVSTFFGIDKYVVISGSMERELYAGAMVVVNRNAKYEDITRGDIIIFKYEDMNVIHRVVDRKDIDGESHLKTKGDSNAHDDGYLTTANNYCGKALFHIPKVFGFMIDFFKMIER